jgi:hypothetical protein
MLLEAWLGLEMRAKEWRSFQPTGEQYLELLQNFSPLARRPNFIVKSKLVLLGDLQLEDLAIVVIPHSAM